MAPELAGAKRFATVEQCVAVNPLVVAIVERSGDPHDRGFYVNLIADDETDRIPAAYGANYTRLREAKQRWDPSNLFSNKYNIPPG